MNTGIYQIINKLNGKRYIGSAVNLKRRKNHHDDSLSRNINHNISLQRAYNKYGKENFEFQILLYCSKEDLLFYEQRAIDAYNFETLYNIRIKAESNLGLKHSDESKKKLSIKNTGKKLSVETCQKISEWQKGENGFWYGKHHSDETKKKIGQKGEKHHNYGKKSSKETRLKMSESRKGEKNGMYGKKHSPETKLKISQIRKGKAKQRIFFTIEQIQEIKEMRENKISYQKIAEKFNCSYQTIFTRYKLFIK